MVMCLNYEQGIEWVEDVKGLVTIQKRENFSASWNSFASLKLSMDQPHTGNTFLSSSPRASNTATTSSKSTAAAKVISAPKPIAQESEASFTKDDIRNVVSWLEDPSNLASIYGPPGQPKLDKMSWNSDNGYNDLSEVLYRLSKGRLNLSGDEVRVRLDRHKTLYKATKEALMSPSFGVTFIDRWEGVYTTSQKLEKLCTCFSRMDEIFQYKVGVDGTDTEEEGETIGRTNDDTASHSDTDPRRGTDAQVQAGFSRSTVLRKNQQYADAQGSDMEISCDSDSGQESRVDSLASTIPKHRGSPISSNKRQSPNVYSPVSVKRSKVADVPELPFKWHAISSTSIESLAPIRRKVPSIEFEALAFANALREEWEKSTFQKTANSKENNLGWKNERTEEMDATAMKLELEKLEVEKIRLNKQHELELQKLEVQKMESANQLELQKLEKMNEAKKMEMISSAWSLGIHPNDMKDLLDSIGKKME
ncbi:hypothetical protein BGX27_011405 [Mortierella sp. AM989]|nr:hypothetical protein BGX27_011405 [Mortierella sp. AM989]